MSYSEMVRGVAKSVQGKSIVQGTVRSVDSINRQVSVALAGSTAVIRAIIPNDIDTKYITEGSAVEVNTQRTPILISVLDQPSRSEETSAYQAAITELEQRIARLELIVESLILNRDTGGVQKALIEALPRTSNRGY